MLVPNVPSASFMMINMITGLLLLLTDLLGYLLLTINTLWCVDCVCVCCLCFFLKIWDQHTCSLFLRLCLTTNSLLKEYSAIIFKRVKSVLILAWHFAELYNCWSIVESCRLSQCICSIRWGYSAMFYRSWSTYSCVFGALVALLVYLCRDRYTPHFCLFADDEAFLLASTLVPVEEFDDQSAWLRVVNEDPHSCSTHEGHVLKCSKEWSLCWFCFEFWPSCPSLLVVECCRLAHCICSLILGYFVMFYWCDPRTSVLLVRWLHCILTCLEIEIRTVHSCLFADDGAFILASTLVPVEEFDDQSAWLRVVYAGSTFLLDAWSRHVV